METPERESGQEEGYQRKGRDRLESWQVRGRGAGVPGAEGEDGGGRDGAGRVPDHQERGAPKSSPDLATGSLLVISENACSECVKANRGRCIWRTFSHVQN